MGLWDGIQGVVKWLDDSDQWVIDRAKDTPGWINDRIHDPKPGAPKPIVGTQANSPYVMKNAGQLANEAAGRTSNDYGPPRINPDDFATSGSSGASAAAYVQSLINGINESFDRQRGALDTNKASSAAGIQRNFDTFKQGVANNQALYQQGSAAIQAEITRRMAESAARNAETSGQVSAAVGGIGGSASAAAAQAAANQASLASSQGYQQDLASRLDQIVGANQRSAENSGELVRQGASGNLETNYNAMLNALLAQREQSILQARQSGSGGGGGGGGGGTDYSKAYKQFNDRQKLDWALNDETPDPMQIVNMMLRNGGSDAAAGLAYLASLNQKPSESK
jgi:hypothetical protein